MVNYFPVKNSYEFYIILDKNIFIDINLRIKMKSSVIGIYKIICLSMDKSTS